MTLRISELCLSFSQHPNRNPYHPAKYIYIHPHANTNTSTLEYIHIHKAYILNILRTKQEKIIRFDPECQIFAPCVCIWDILQKNLWIAEICFKVSELIYSCADSKPRGKAWLIVLIKPETSISSEFDIRKWSKAGQGHKNEDDIINHVAISKICIGCEVVGVVVGTNQAPFKSAF